MELILFREHSIFQRSFLADIDSMIRLLVVFAPMIVYWALYNQQYNIWVVQSLQMDGRLWGDILLRPDHMAFFNPVLIVTLAPIFHTLYRRVDRSVKVT